MKTIGFIITLLLSWVGCQAQIVTIPDANFKAYLLNLATINTNGDTEIQVSEAQAAQGMNLTGQNVSDLTGLEAFTGLLAFWCDNCNFATPSLDLSNTPSLTILRVSNSQLQSIQLSSNLSQLIEVTCPNNQLSTPLDLSGATALQTLACANNQLTVLRVNSTNLATITCQNNQIDTLDLSTCVNLNNVNCSHNGMRSLTLSPNRLLELFCDHNQLTTLTLPETNRLDCGNNLLTSLTLDNATSVRCDSNQLTELIVQGFVTRMDTLIFDYNNIDSFDTGISTGLRYVDGSYNQMRAFITRSEDLKDIFLNDNQLEIIWFKDILQNIANSNFDARNNPNLWCIAFDFNGSSDIAYAQSNWTNADNYGNGLQFGTDVTCSPIWLDVDQVATPSTMKIYPNPSSGWVQIDLGTNLDEGVAQIYNAQGQLLATHFVYDSTSLELPPTKGLYYIALITKERQQGFTIIRE